MSRRKKRIVVFAVLFLGLARIAVAAAPDGNRQFLEGRRVTALEVSPSEVTLRGKFAYAQLVITAVLDDGARLDATRLAWTLHPSSLVQLSPDGRLTPRTAGTDQLVFGLGQAQASLRLHVADADDNAAVDFATDVQPVLSRAGCNAGTCHGSREGKNGFKLSLRGYDSLFDHRALTDDHAARRINRVAADQSLMLLKCTGAVPHEGGVVLEPASDYYEIVRTWVAQGAAYRADTAGVAAIEIAPQNPIVPLPDMQQQFRIVATYKDGTKKDVTREAFIESNNGDIVTVQRPGLATSLRRGEVAVLARYQGAYAATTLTVMGDRDGFRWNDPPAFNYIDELVYNKLKRVKTLPGELASDEAFLRRVYLDLTGLPPTAEQVVAFLEDQRPTRSKRDAIIDALVGSEAYVEHRTNKWADLLQVNSKYLGREGAEAFRKWIRQQIAGNVPYDQFAREILTAEGSNRENPAASYFKILRDPAETMENTTHLFLAVRFNCNKCHDHPFERWTQDQYYHLAAYFARVGLKKDPQSGDRRIGGTAVEGAKPLYEIVFEKPEGEVIHQRTGAVADPLLPYQGEIAADHEASRRDALAWITSADNQYFARSFVNRQWAYLMGVGLVEPIDDIRAGNPPSNPELLDRLTQEFIEGGFDTQQLVKTICRSRTYQLSVATNAWNEGDRMNFSHALPRRLPAEVLLDAVYQVTGSQSRFPGVAPGTRAAALPDVSVKLPGGFLDQLGRPPRESACECERSNNLMLGPVMALVNGPTIAEAVSDPTNALVRIEADLPDDRRLVEAVFLRVLNRPPSAQEMTTSVNALQDLELLRHEAEATQAAFVARKQELEDRFGAWVAQQHVLQWRPLARVEAAATGPAILIPQPDHSIFAKGANGLGSYTIVAYTDLPYITGLRLEALTDERLPEQGPGQMGGSGNFVLSELRVTAAPLRDPAAARRVALNNAQADVQQNGYAVQAAIDGKQDTGWAIAPAVGKHHQATFQFQEAVHHEGGSRLVVVLDHHHQDAKHALGRFRLSITGSAPPIEQDKLPADVLVILRTPRPLWTDQQVHRLKQFQQQQDPQYVALEHKAQLVNNPRLLAIQDLAWALINSPAFLFNR